MKGRNKSFSLPLSTLASSSSSSSSSSSLGIHSAFAWAALLLFVSLSCFFGAAESALFYSSPGQLSSFTSIHRQQPPQQHWKQSSLKDELTCHTLAHHQVECNGTKYEPVRQHDTTGSSRFYVDLSISIGLVAFAGLMSGLTMGLMSIDRMGLKILKNGGVPIRSA